MPFGSYLLLKRLAVGGMAELFLAKDKRVDRMVVLKRILPYLAEEAEFVRMFLDEARIASALHHPSIVELFELGHLEGSTFIAMEWVDGIDLRRIAQREQEKGGFMPPGIAAWITARLCEGLFHAHIARDAAGQHLGIIHRDVSPQNVMLSFRGDVKLVDFGIAKATAWMGRSKPGVIKGKFLYLAPEQLTTEPLDHRTDLFALGTMLYELTTGQSPFYRTSTEAVIYAIRMEEPEPPATVRKGVPDTLSRIILKCLTKDRDQRYQTADEIRLALEDFMRLEVPTTRADVQRYVSTLFGDENERTTIFIPPNAKSEKDERNEQRVELARVEQPRTDPVTTPPRRNRSDEASTDSGTREPGPFDNIDEERTMPLSSVALPLVEPRKPKGAAPTRIPEGRRETGEREIKADPTDKDQLEINDPPTGPTRNDRPKVRAAFAAAEAEKAWEPEVTAPLARPAPPRTASLVDRPVARRDLVMTAEIDKDPRSVGSGDFAATAVSTSGARDVEIGQVFAPLLPTMMGESAPELTRAAPKTPPQASRSSRPQPRLPPPIASPADSIPELSMASDVVSAGENTIGVLASTSDVERRVAQFDDDDETSEPSPPPASTRAPPRVGPGNPRRSPTALVAKRPVPGDPDDDVETVDQQNEFSVSRGGTSSQKVMIAIFGGAAVVLVILLVVLLWPSSAEPPKKLDKPPKNPVTKKDDRPEGTVAPPRDATPPAVGEVQVQIRALKGTSITLDNKPVAPDATLNRKPGELVLKFVCPSKKKNKPTMTLRATIPDSERLMIVEVPCP